MSNLRQRMDLDTLPFNLMVPTEFQRYNQIQREFKPTPSGDRLFLCYTVGG